VHVDIADPGTLSMENGYGLRGRGQMSREAICRFNTDSFSR
jgi:hypothetical protein